ncbi:MAG TPA: tryptophan synthase subunit alpha [Acidimicrobiales bacterium]|nr:tryptophan synthase subunit alpha [Acidimicrobiales bacterium]
MTVTSVGTMEASLRARRDAGAKLLVPYVTGGIDGWVAVVEAVAAAGADAVEIGIPFSDPMMDGSTIQEASALALARGATPAGILAEIADTQIRVPLAVMTYYNIPFRAGLQAFARDLASSGIAGAIVPDLPLEELDEWEAAAASGEIEAILLAAPTTDDERLVRICERSRGWVYAVGLMGVTGERSGLAASATLMGKRLKAVTDKPVLIGVGVSTPEQAVEASTYADGVIVGSALVRRLLEGEGPDGAARLVAELRAGLDSAF